MSVSLFVVSVVKWTDNDLVAAKATAKAERKKNDLTSTFLTTLVYFVKKKKTFSLVVVHIVARRSKLTLRSTHIDSIKLKIQRVIDIAAMLCTKTHV